MRYLKVLVVSIFSMVVVACVSVPHTFSDVDGSQDFSSYKRFAWASATPYDIQSDYIVSPFVTEEIQRAIQAELITKGYTLTGDPSKADFIVSFTIGARDKVKVTQDIAMVSDIDRWTWGQQYYPVQGFETKDRIHQYVEGMLAIDAFDAQRKAPVWHGYGKKRLNTEERRGTVEGIPSAVQSILRSFPAQTK
jgi:hypothetical protein